MRGRRGADGLLVSPARGSHCCIEPVLATTLTVMMTRTDWTLRSWTVLCLLCRFFFAAGILEESGDFLNVLPCAGPENNTHRLCGRFPHQHYIMATLASYSKI